MELESLYKHFEAQRRSSQLKRERRKVIVNNALKLMYFRINNPHHRTRVIFHK